MFLQAAKAAGSLGLPRVPQAADRFVGLFCKPAYRRPVLSVPKPSGEQDPALVKSNVGLFMGACGIR